MEEFWQQIKEWVSDFLTRELLPEVVALVVVVLLGLLAGWILRRILQRGERRLQDGPALRYASWLEQIVALGVAVTRPFAIWLAGKMVIKLFANIGWPHGVLDYVIPFFGLWLLYRTLAAAIGIWLKPEQKHLWRNQILRPTMVILVLMHVVGLLDSILAYQVTFTKDVSVPVGAILGGLIALYVFVLLGNWVRGLLRDVILPQMDADPSIIPIIATFSGYTAIVIGVFVGLMVAGVDLTAVTPPALTSEEMQPITTNPPEGLDDVN